MRYVGKLILGIMTLICGPAMAESMTVYKSPTCGCCSDWVEHMQAAGFDVTVHDVNDVNRIKVEAGLSPELASCHTAFVNGYIFEGHVPAGDIQRFLAENPDGRGLSVPGMPAGENVPGMEVPGKRASYASYLIPNHQGEQPVVYQRHD